MLAAAVAWGQIASAHLSNGLVVGTFALGVYLLAALIPLVRSGEVPLRTAAGLVGLLVVALPLVNLAVLLPRLAYVPGTTSSLGYTEQARRAAELLGKPPPPTPIGVTSRGSWPLTLVDPIGGYAGAVALAFALGGWRRSKALFFGFGGLAAVCYLLSLEPVAQALSHVLAGSTIGDFYLHVPSRFSDGVVLAVPVLVALGLQAFRDAATWRDRLVVVAPGVFVWWVVAPAIGILHNEVWLPLAAAAVAVAIVVPAVRRPVLLVALPAVIAVELVVNGLLGQTEAESLHGQIEIPAAELGIPPLRRPEVNVADYLRAGSIVGALRSGPAGRYATIPPIKDHRGLIPYQEPEFWPFLGNQRGVLFGLESPDGVNPVQNVRHWTFVRATQPGHIYYNASFFHQLSPLARDLLQVNGVTIDAAFACQPKKVGGPADQVAVEGTAALCRPNEITRRASLVGSWVVATSEDDALAKVTAEGFDPSATVVLERTPSVGAPPSAPSTGSVHVVRLGPQDAEFDVRSDGPAILLVRTTFDDGWHATVDGNATPLLAGDYVDQAVAVPAGSHRVRLAYDDPWVGRGLLGSFLVVGGAGGLAIWLERRRRRERRGRGGRAVAP
jgi:hypothetical protein